jgi:hypothetical protein
VFKGGRGGRLPSGTVRGGVDRPYTWDRASRAAPDASAQPVDHNALVIAGTLVAYVVFLD